MKMDEISERDLRKYLKAAEKRGDSSQADLITAELQRRRGRDAAAGRAEARRFLASGGKGDLSAARPTPTEVVLGILGGGCAAGTLLSIAIAAVTRTWLWGVVALALLTDAVVFYALAQGLGHLRRIERGIRND